MGSASRGRYKKGEIMTISKERKAELTAKFGKNAQDTGNSKVQVAILSERIKELTEHMKFHQKDFHTRRGLLMLVVSVVVSSPTSRRTTSMSTVSSSRSSAFATTSSRDLCMQGRPLGAPFHVGPLSRR